MCKFNVSSSSRAMLVAAVALAFSAPVFAQSSSAQGGGNSMSQPGSKGAADNTNSKAGPMSPNTSAPTSTATESNPSSSANRGAADNSNSKVAPASPSGDMNAWTSEYATSNKGRVSREAYMNEMGRRWDSQDKSKHGLTPAEVARMTGKTDVDNATPARTGSGVAPGNMGPGSVKAQ